MITEFVFEQLTAATTWNITHNLNQEVVCDAFADIGGGNFEKVVPEKEVKINNNQLQLVFTVATAGFARIR